MVGAFAGSAMAVPQWMSMGGIWESSFGGYAVHRKNILGHGLMTTPDMTKAAGERRIRPNATCMS
jgi:hypothetical protein